MKQAREGVVDLITGGLGVTIKQVGDNQRGGRIVVTGLHHTHIHHRLLHQTELVPATERLGGAYLRTFQLGGDQQGGVDHLAVEENGVGTGKTEAVIAVAHRVHPALIEQHPLGIVTGLADDGTQGTVQGKVEFHHACTSCCWQSTSRSATTTPVIYRL